MTIIGFIFLLCVAYALGWVACALFANHKIAEAEWQVSELCRRLHSRGGGA